MINPPCKDKNGTDCPNRAVGCQGTCERYLAFRKARDEELERHHMESVSARYVAENAYRHKKNIRNPTASQRRLINQR